MSGWGSWLAGADAGSAEAKPNFHSVVDKTPQDSLFGALTPSDLEWTCAGGFTTETQTWYTVLEDGAFATSQIIHSAVGLWYPQIQITFKYFNPKTGQKVWKSVNVTHFVTPPPAGTGRDKAATFDKRSCKADQFSVLLSTAADGSETYTIDANMDTDLQLSYTFTRPAAHKGWKLGAGPEGAKSIFGANPASPDGYVLHRFWPRVESAGHILIKGQAIDAKGHGMFVHAIQGMRPNLVASAWNFANFQSSDLGGVSGIMMEFTTTSDYGGPSGSGKPKAEGQATRETLTVNIGSISVGNKLIAVSGSTRGAVSALKGSQSTVEQKDASLDAETGYKFPSTLRHVWDAPLLKEDGKGDASSPVKAELVLDLGKPAKGELKGLIEKVDVLGEVPYMVRKMVNYVAGTKPYIYQTLNPATLKLELPASCSGEAGSGAKEAKGSVFCETTFISVA